MKKNFYNDKEREEYIAYLESVRKNTDIPQIYLPFIVGTSNKFSPISGCEVTDMNDKIITGVSINFKNPVSDKEKRDKVKEVINSFIDYAFDTYELYKKEVGINEEAKVSRK